MLLAVGCLGAAAATAQDFVVDDRLPAPVDMQLLPPAEPGGPVILEDPYLPGPFRAGGAPGVPRDAFDDLWAPRPWSWQILPNNLIYTSYLAGPKEPRFATVWYDDTAPRERECGNHCGIVALRGSHQGAEQD